GLIAYWSFDEGTGPQAVDYTGNGSDGTLLANAAWTTGKFNGAVSFSGDSEDQVFVGTPDLLNITGAVTVMAWVKPNGVSNYGVIAGIDQSGGATYDQFVLKTTVSSSFQLTFQVTANGNGTNATDSVSLTTRSSETSDGWVHVAGVFIPGESVNLYVNGELVASTPVSIETLQSTLSVDRPFRIGNMSSSSNYGFNGAIDELRVFAASVSPADIATYAAGEAIPDPVGTIIEQGATWAYLDDGSDQGSAWTETDFNDSSWSTGAAQLGYGDGDEVTTLGYGGNSSNKYPTAYFRKSFELTEAQLATIDELKFSIIRDDGVVVYINGTEVVRDNLPEGNLTYQTYALSAVDGDNEDTFFEYSVSPDALVAGTNVIAVEIHQQRASSSDISFDLILDALTADDVAAQDEVVVTTGTTWKYLDDGSDQGSAWTAPAFDDSAWSSGPSQLGYGDGDEATVLSYGNDSSNKHITYYFRTSFEVADASDYAGLLFEVLRDDGVIVYLNGHEVIRDNMPATGVDYQTFSSEIVSGDDESTFFEFPVAASYLVDGTNVIAAEIHNRDGTSSDLGFDLKVTLQAIPDPNAPVFSDDTIVGTSAVAMGTYAFSLADYVTDADGDELVFSKVSGPDWLTVNPDGTLSGTPGTGDIGENSFVISVTDNDEGTSTVVLEITVGEAGELARAPLPGSDEALVFGVIPDTQGGTNGTPPDEAAAIAQRFIGHAPAFIIHVGDVTDGNSSSGDTKLSQLEDLKDLLVNPLAEHGIGFYPVRGNHDSNAYANTSSGVSAWAAAFPYLFEGEGAVIDPTDVPGGSPSSPNTSNFCYVLDAGHDTFFVSVDQWNGGSSENYSNWVAAKFAEIRAEHPDAHIFGYSHSGLYAMASHPAMSEFVSGGADPYIAAGKQYQIDGWFSGHNHIYDRSMAVNLSDDNKPYMFDFTCGSASEKFYSLSRTPAEDQHLNRLVDSNTVTGRPIAYLLAQVNGPFVSVETYMSPDTTGAGTFNDWSVWDAYTYSRNGLQFTVAAGQNYNERNITDTAPEEDGFVGTTVSMIDGVNSDTTTFTVGSTSFSPYRNITTGWWTRDQWYDAGSRQIVSDIVSIHGMRNVSDRNRSDMYTLVMSYDAAAMSDLQQQHLSIVAFLDENTADADEGEWIDAVQATLGTPASEPFMRAPAATDELGAWGIDVENGVVWARLDYQGDFAIASNVPDTDADGLADAWEMDHFGNLDQTAEGDPDGDGLTNLQEQAAGTSPLLSDTDGDLFSDAVEVQYGLDPVSPDSELSGSVLDYLRQHPGMQNSHGLYTRDSLGALTGQTLMEVDGNGDLQLQIQLWESTDLENWSPVGSAHGHTLPLESGAPHFYQWGMGGTQD
ncbi:MAG: LamG-like jellyroll fold domain-containing protein, partial [Verrucomicrobiota bacterium JB024]|nr:LamG-like jellyroll fold domain-containing protein [Verrucomicrobiota bacterium JB024]